MSEPEPTQSNLSQLGSRKGSAVPEQTIDYLPTQPYKGARDFYPEQQRLHDWIFGKMTDVARRFGFDPYNGPLLEAKALYVAKSGTELGNEQLYHFTDRGDREVAIRPEMTPTLARMVAGKINELNFPIRWYSTPNLWRYERPQRGRTREHWQLNVDIIGTDSVYAEADILELAATIMRDFGAPDSTWKIYVNNRRFVNQLLAETFQLDATKSREVLRVIDKKAKILPEEFKQALLIAGLSGDSASLLAEMCTWSITDVVEHYSATNEGARQLGELFSHLKGRGLQDCCAFNLEVVRGLDYYTGTIFEMYDVHPENRRALFGGGRYDQLLSLFQAINLSGVGFGLGDVTISNFLETHNLLPKLKPSTQVMVLFSSSSEEAVVRGLEIASELRKQGIAVEPFIPPDAKLAKQFQFAERRAARFAIIIGEKELASNTVVIKELEKRTQEVVSREEVSEYFKKASL